MKRLLFFVLMLLAIGNIHAQSVKKHFDFTSIPLSGTTDDFVGKLKQQGWISVPRTEEDGQKAMKGIFRADSATLYINSTKTAHLVYSVKVVFDRDKEKTIAELLPVFNEYVEFYKSEFGEPLLYEVKEEQLHTPFSQLGPIDTRAIFDLPEGFIYITMQREDNDNGAVTISCIDAINGIENLKDNKGIGDWDSFWKTCRYVSAKDKQIDRETIREICGIPVGTPFSEVKEKLANTYGAPLSRLTGKDRITYENIEYNGVTFDRIYFHFQHDGSTLRFNECTFILFAKTETEAEINCEVIHKMFADKYTMESYLDQHGYFYYIGGRSPINPNECGFYIDTKKYNRADSKRTSRYAARLLYGPYSIK
ncbi:MAG: hypothetical protein J6Y39_02240 [Bacteroidaceae bacterium]|nr:hypothetical protein [Bacteroidaceae bacterium]